MVYTPPKNEGPPPEDVFDTFPKEVLYISTVSITFWTKLSRYGLLGQFLQVTAILVTFVQAIIVLKIYCTGIVLILQNFKGWFMVHFFFIRTIL